MTSLTYEIKDAASPVSVWLRRTFPHHGSLQSAYRSAAGPALVLPSPAVALGTQGAAIDWWLRMLVAPAVSVSLPVLALGMNRADCGRAGLDLFRELQVQTALNGASVMEPARFADRPDEWWARVCYALSLLVELYRASSVERSRLKQLDGSSTLSDLLALANDDEVADLIAMRALAQERLIPQLPAGSVSTGMTFEGSRDLAADGDLIAGGMLVDFKASQGGKPRADGTRATSIARYELDQVLGYSLMDYSDKFSIHTVAIYAVRFGYLAAWPLVELCDQLAGHPVELSELRQKFKYVLQVDLPKHYTSLHTSRRQ